MTTDSGPTSGPSSFTIRSTEDVIALVPLVLGFHPCESVVLMTFGAPAGSFHARVDLPLAPETRRNTADLLARAVLSNRATTAMVVVCTDDHDAAVAALHAISGALRAAGAVVVLAVRIDGRRWWSLLEDDPLPTPYDVSAHPFAAQRVLSGAVVRPDRQAVVDSLVGTDPLAADRVGVAADRMSAQRRDAGVEAHWLRDWLAGRSAWSSDEPTEPVEEPDLARVLSLVHDPEHREVACVDLTRVRARGLVELWSEVVRRAPQRYVPGPAALLALTAWLAGDGALAWCAVDRALAEDPGLELARCVAHALQDAVPPSTWRGLDPSACPLLAENPTAGRAAS